MAASRTVRSELFRVFLLTLLMLFLIPCITLVFIRHVQRAEDADFVHFAQAQVAADTRLSPAEKRRAADAYGDYSVTAVCASTALEDQESRKMACSRYSMVWQLHWAAKATWWTLALAGLMLGLVAVLGGLAFANKNLRYRSFIAGWIFLRFASAAQVVLQSGMLVWLSFWMTAYFWQKYFAQLIGVVGIAAAVAAFYAIRALFMHAPADDFVTGTAVLEKDAPLLWAHIRRLAERVRAAPPNHLIAGIDANFFVSETPCRVDGHRLTGRMLFVSIPLLRILDRSEADAVFVHELAHLAGGDTRESALLDRKLVQFDEYTWQMRYLGLTIVAHYILRLYRMIFEYALARDSRAREFQADLCAAHATSPQALVQALIKISAYASYRQKVEQDLFSQNRRHGEALSIASFVAEGLARYARSSEFVDAMAAVAVSHPYDSHPALVERMRNIGHLVPEQGYGSIVALKPRDSWIEDIQTSADIEETLWAEYVDQFLHDHEMHLSYRYEPANDQEETVVFERFPNRIFELDNGSRIHLTYRGFDVMHNGTRSLGWDEVNAIEFKDSVLGDSMKVTHPGKRWLRSRTTRIKLKGLRDQKKAFKQAVQDYWYRHQVMRALQKEQTAPAAD